MLIEPFITFFIALRVPQIVFRLDAIPIFVHFWLCSGRKQLWRCWSCHRSQRRQLLHSWRLLSFFFLLSANRSETKIIWIISIDSVYISRMHRNNYIVTLLSSMAPPAVSEPESFFLDFFVLALLRLLRNIAETIITHTKTISSIVQYWSDQTAGQFWYFGHVKSTLLFLQRLIQKIK